MITLPCASLWMPGVIVIVAGFQNIEDSPPEPAATPAKDSPWAVALCSRMPNAPAWAAVAARRAARETALRACFRSKIFILILPLGRGACFCRDANRAFFSDSACAADSLQYRQACSPSDAAPP